MAKFIVNREYETTRKEIEAESFEADSRWVKFYGRNDRGEVELIVSLPADQVLSVEKEGAIE